MPFPSLCVSARAGTKFWDTAALAVASSFRVILIPSQSEHDALLLILFETMACLRHSSHLLSFTTTFSPSQPKTSPSTITISLSCSTSGRPISVSSVRWRCYSSPSDSRGRPPSVIDEEWETERREETRQRERARQEERDVEAEKEADYRKIGSQLKDYPEEDVKEARKLVVTLIKAGEDVEEMIEQASENGELTPLVLLVIRNRLELARQDDERDAIQALDLLYRRVEMEILQSEASMAMQLLNQLLNLHDGFSHEEWLQRARATMLQIFPPEDAFTTMLDLENHMGPIEIPEEDDALLRIDFIREVDDLLVELEAAAVEIEPVSGLDAESVALRLRQQEKMRAIQQVKDLRRAAATLKR